MYSWQTSTKSTWPQVNLEFYRMPNSFFSRRNKMSLNKSLLIFPNRWLWFGRGTWNSSNGKSAFIIESFICSRFHLFNRIIQVDILIKSTLLRRNPFVLCHVLIYFMQKPKPGILYVSIVSITSSLSAKSEI